MADTETTEPEIPVTPAMIEAGAAVFCTFGSGRTGPLVAMIYRAMEEVRRRDRAERERWCANYDR
jgi:hypothetical protein